MTQGLLFTISDLFWCPRQLNHALQHLIDVTILNHVKIIITRDHRRCAGAPDGGLLLRGRACGWVGGVGGWEGEV